MNKFYGTVGFVKEEETKPGVWTPVTTERNYYGDIIRIDRRWDQPTEVKPPVFPTQCIALWDQDLTRK